VEQRKYVILGAGPTGLAFAQTLLDRGEESFVVIEKESVAGGLCRSAEVDGAPLDIGGGHFLDVKRKEVLDLLFRFLPEQEWRQYSRISRIRLRGSEIDYPLEANIWQLPGEDQIDFLESIARAGCVSETPKPEGFAEWIGWKLGERIAQEYMLPYNGKLWSQDLDQLGTYWLEKLPDVSFRDTLASCLNRAPSGTLPAHGTFLYPAEYGYGEVWKRMGDALGDRLLLDTPVTSIDVAKKTVNGRFQAQTIVNTIPWPAWLDTAELPEAIVGLIKGLKNVAIDIDYCPGDPGTDAHWIYEPDQAISYHRVLCRCNFSDGPGHWTETNASRSVAQNGERFKNDYAYPVNSIGKPEAMAEILGWGEEHGILGLGRWGRWEHLNSDVAVADGIAAAKSLTLSLTAQGGI
jgi:protoporphyrinogen oxidase